MNKTIENICYEYCEDVLFSQDSTKKGYPLTIIAYVQKQYMGELSIFLHNHNYSLARIDNFGKYYTVVRFVTKSCPKINSKEKQISEDI